VAHSNVLYLQNLFLGINLFASYRPFYLSTPVNDETMILNAVLPEEKLAGEIIRFPMYKEIEQTRKR
jgi:hypothetical protein